MTFACLPRARAFFVVCAILCFAARNDVAAQSFAAKRNVAERYWALLLDNPRPGAALDRVFDDAARNDGVDALVDRLRATADAAQGLAKAKALTAQALVLARRNDRDAALRALRDAREIAPECVQTTLALVDLLGASGRLQELCEVCDDALERKLDAETRVALLQKLGETRARLGETDKADAAWSRAVEECGDRDDVLASVAESRADAGSFRAAAELYALLETRAIEKNDPETAVECAVAAGDLKIRLGENDSAVKDFERAIDRLAPSNWLRKSLRDRIEYVFLLRSDYDGLVKYYRALVAERPNDLDSVARLAVALASLGRGEDAERAIESGLERAPKSVELRRVELELAASQGRWARVRETYARLDELGALDSDDLLAWGDALLKDDSLALETRRAQALDVWSRILESQSSSRLALAEMVAEKMRDANFDDDAEKLLTNLTQEYPDDFELAKRFADFLLEKDRDDDALRALARCVDRAPQNADLRVARAQFLRAKHFQKEAIADAEKAVELAPQDFKKRFELCQTLLDAGSDDSLDARLDELDALAATDDERARAFDLRLDLRHRRGDVGAFLDELDAKILNGADDDALKTLYWKKIVAALRFDDPNGALDAALDAIQRRVASNAAMQRIQEIVAKSQAPERSIELLKLALAVDPQNRARIKASIMTLQIEIGDSDAAIATAREIVAEPESDASSLRAAADALAQRGLYDEAIDVLRNAAARDAADRASLLKLAAMLDETGRSSEATDVLWKLFDNCARLEDKLSIVDALAKLHAKLDRFDDLKNRLRADAKSADARRDAAVCLSRAFMSLKDYDSARSALESALTISSSQRQGDVFLLHALSNLAELQNDLDAAIQFQERLCAVDDSRAEIDRLLALYRRDGRNEKARECLKKVVMPRDPFWKQLETVDALLSFEEYDDATDAIDDLERRFGDSWEIAARKIELAAWTRPEDLPELLRKEATRNAPLDSKSAKSLTLERAPQTPAVAISGDAMRLGAIKGRAAEKFDDPEECRNLAAQTLLVVYRDMLTVDDKAARSASAARAKPQAPVLAFPNFAAAKLLFRALEDRVARSDLRNARNPENLDAFLQAFHNDGESRDALKLRFAAFEYAAALEENLGDPETTKPRASAWRRDARDLALKLARDDDKWRAEVFPALLDELLVARDPREQKERAAFLVDALDASLRAGAVKRDAAVWNRAAALVDALRAMRLDEETKRAAALLQKAAARDYAVLLDVDPNSPFSSDEIFVASLDAAEALLEKQVRSADDVDKARQQFGAVFAARIAREARRAYDPVDADERARADAVAEYWRAFSERIAFGRRPLVSNVELHRRELFEAKRLARETIAASAEMEDRLFAILERAIAFDRKANDLFGAKARTKLDDAPPVPLADAFGYLARDEQTAFNLAAYLVDKTLYGGERAQSCVESGKLLETTAAALFALDVADANPGGPYALDRLQRFQSFLRKELLNDGVPALRECAQRNLEILDVVVARLSGEPALESAEELREKAKDALQTSDERDPRVKEPLRVALALIAKSEKNATETLEQLELVRTVAFADVKARELAVLEAFPNSDDSGVRARKERAIQTLLGARLDEKEAARLLAALESDRRDDDAAKIRKRLQAFATELATIDRLLDATLARVESGDALDDDDVVFALRVFRTPSSAYKDRAALEKARSKALVALEAAGKLEQTTEALERLVATAPGAAEFLLRLADARAKLGKTDDAKAALELAAKKLPNDPAILADYAACLARLGEIDDAKIAFQNAWLRKPDDYFNEKNRPDFWSALDEIALFRRFPKDLIAARAYDVSAALLVDRTIDDARDDADRLLEDLWKGEGVERELRDAFRNSAAKNIALANAPELFPLLEEWLADSIEPNQDEQTPYPDYNDVHRLARWNSTRPTLLSDAALQLAIVSNYGAERLQTLLGRLDRAIETFARQTAPNAARFSAALALKIQILAKTKRFDALHDALASAEKRREFCAKGLKNDPLAIAIALEETERPEFRTKALEFFERASEENPHPAYEQFYLVKTCSLGLQSADRDVKEQYAARAQKKLEDLLKLAANADFKSTRRVADSLETLESIEFAVDALASALQNADEGERARDAFDASNVEARFTELRDDDAQEWRAFFDKLRATFP